MSMMIHVDPARLESSASHIEQQSNAYEREYAKLFQSVEAMSNAWQGKDNQAFTTQIQGFRKDFSQMTLLMREYAEFLKISARLYRETQEERVAMARRLHG